MQVQDQAFVTYAGTWVASYLDSPHQLASAVTAALAGDGLVVVAINVNSSIAQDASLTAGPFTIGMQLQVQNGLGFASEQDVVSIIRHEVYVASGQFPLADSVPQVLNPGSTPTITGQPGSTTLPDTSSNASGCSFSDYFDSSSDCYLFGALSSASTGVSSALVFMAIGIIAVILLTRNRV